MFGGIHMKIRRHALTIGILCLSVFLAALLLLGLFGVEAFLISPLVALVRMDTTLLTVAA